MSESNELIALFLLVSLDEKDRVKQGFQKQISNNENDWEVIGQLAAQHHLRPWLYDHYKQLSEGIVPQEVMDVYQRMSDQVRFRQLKHMREFFRIKEALDEKGIPMVPFKGFRLGQEYYGDPALRESSDLDVLIRRKDLQAIIDTMGKMGYSTEPGYNSLNHSLNKLIKLYPEYNMDLWENGQRIAHVEFHWQISRPPLNIGCFYEEMTPFITKGQLQGREYDCFTPGGDLLMAAFHHGGKEEWTRLGHILDIGQIIHKFPDADHEKAISWAEERQLSRIVLTGIQLAHQLCKVEIPRSIAAKANAPEILSLAKNRLEKIERMANGMDALPWMYNTGLYHLRSRDTFPARLRLALGYPAHFLLRGRLKLERMIRAAL